MVLLSIQCNSSANVCCRFKGNSLNYNDWFRLKILLQNMVLNKLGYTRNLDMFEILKISLILMDLLGYLSYNIMILFFNC